MRLCALIPSYNNEASIGAVVRAVLNEGLPVLVLDDGSSDGTADRAREAGATVVSHPDNRGKGQALLTGFHELWAQGFSHAISLDGDGQHRASDLPAFCKACREQPEALFVGCRSMTAPGVPRSSRIGRAISDFMLWVSAGHELKGQRPDTQCGYRCYPLSTVLALPLKGQRYEFEMEVLVRAAWNRIPVRELPIDVFYPPPNERVSHFDGWADNRRIVRAYTKLSLMRLFWPLFRPWKKLLPLQPAASPSRLESPSGKHSSGPALANADSAGS